MKNNIINIISLVLIIIFNVLEVICIYVMPMLNGIICLSATFIVSIGVYIAFALWKDDRSPKVWASIDILTCISKTAYLLISSVFVIFYICLFFAYHLPPYTDAIKTTAIVKEQVVTKRSEYLILEYQDQEGTTQRATLTISGKGAYLENDKVAIRYNPADLKNAYADIDITPGSTLYALSCINKNPEIVHE